MAGGCRSRRSPGPAALPRPAWPCPPLPPARLRTAPRASPGQGRSAAGPRRPPAASPCSSRLGAGSVPAAGLGAGLPSLASVSPPVPAAAASASRRAAPPPPPGLTGRLRRFRLPHAAGGGGGQRAEGRVRRLPLFPSPPFLGRPGRLCPAHRAPPLPAGTAGEAAAPPGVTERCLPGPPPG